jgi:hypothetical protein
MCEFWDIDISSNILYVQSGRGVFITFRGSHEVKYEAEQSDKVVIRGLSAWGSDWGAVHGDHPDK